MATLTAWKFHTPRGADDALKKLEKLHTEMLINLHDARGGQLGGRAQEAQDS